jgi:Ran GTPase-activating protein (RanGAP) involved in mRNA processing and transport
MACEEAGGALGELLRTNSVLKELNVSKNHDRWTDGANDGPGFGQRISKGLADNGAMSSLHVGSNGIPEREMRKIMAIAMSKESMKILCEVPFKNKTITELDVSGKNLGAEGALVIAEYLDGNGAMSKLDISNNAMNASGCKMICEAIQGNNILTELSMAKNDMTWAGNAHGDMSAVVALCKALPNMEAMLSLNLAGNQFGAKGAKIVAKAMKV